MEGVEQEDWQAERGPASCGNPLLSAEATYEPCSNCVGARHPHNSHTIYSMLTISLSQKKFVAYSSNTLS